MRLHCTLKVIVNEWQNHLVPTEHESSKLLSCLSSLGISPLGAFWWSSDSSAELIFFKMLAQGQYTYSTSTPGPSQVLREDHSESWTYTKECEETCNVTPSSQDTRRFPTNALWLASETRSLRLASILPEKRFLLTFNSPALNNYLFRVKWNDPPNFIVAEEQSTQIGKASLPISGGRSPDDYWGEIQDNSESNPIWKDQWYSRKSCGLPI